MDFYFPYCLVIFHGILTVINCNLTFVKDLKTVGFSIFFFFPLGTLVCALQIIWFIYSESVKIFLNVVIDKFPISVLSRKKKKISAILQVADQRKRTSSVMRKGKR